MKLDVVLIPQFSNQTCWQAAMRMVRSTRASASIDPTASVPWLVKKGTDNQGLNCQMGAKFTSLASVKVWWDPNSTDAQKKKVPHTSDCSEPRTGLKEAGFHAVPAQPDPIEALWLDRQLKAFGPLFAGGSFMADGSNSLHAVVITGVDPATATLYVNDPWPPGTGTKDRSESVAWLNTNIEREIPLHYSP
ncbi:MAG: hypothetical protein IPJ12_15320 [Betaproteobacteria bacterium]|jgi:hypothetical protein|nr:hypothetical protein [Betaproteobacteria bacterium]